MDELLNILQQMHPDVDFENNDELIDSGVLDSFDIVFLISQIKEVFDVKVTADKILPEYFNSADGIMALIKELEEED